MRDLQRRLSEWQDRNFDPVEPGIRALQLTLGVCEEAGELSHTILKRDQGIRGTREEHDADARDAIADVVIYAMNLCSNEGWDFETIVRETAEKVMLRDWQKNRENGGENG